MRFLVMHKNDPHTERGELPPPELIAQMGAFIGEYAQRGVFVGGEGLPGSAHRTRLTFRDGACTVKHGPYAGERELPAAMLVLKVGSRDEAIGWAERYGKILGDGELEVGPVNEPWDLGMMPKPVPAPPLRVLVIEKDGAPRTPKQKADLTRLKTEMTKAGVLMSQEQLRPAAEAKRLRFRNNDLEVQDGPFTESKELIGGFSIMRLDSMDEAISICRRYAAILGGTLEIDIRGAEEPQSSDA